MQQELHDEIMGALYQALECGSLMLNRASSDFRIQEIADRLIVSIDSHIHPPDALFARQCKEWARACKAVLQETSANE